MTRFNSRYLLGKRSFRSLTGVEASHFHKMLERLRPHWREKVVETKDRSGRPWGVGGLEEHLLVLLILYRCCVTQDFLACLYQTDQAAISRALHRIEPLAARILGVKRSLRVTREEAEALIIDCTEQPIQRPIRKQRCWYSGKKKRHTIKTEIIVTEKGRIASASKPAPGRVSDITVRRRGPPLPKGARAYADSGYQGLQKDHPDTEIPYKKTKKHPLTKDEKAYNHALSRFRVRVEHSIARLKSFRMLSERYRYPKATYAAKFALIAGIVNIAAGF
jgi:IS5 family transposase